MSPVVCGVLSSVNDVIDHVGACRGLSCSMSYGRFSCDHMAMLVVDFCVSNIVDILLWSTCSYVAVLLQFCSIPVASPSQYNRHSHRQLMPHPLRQHLFFSYRHFPLPKSVLQSSRIIQVIPPTLQS